MPTRKKHEGPIPLEFGNQALAEAASSLNVTCEAPITGIQSEPPLLWHYTYNPITKKTQHAANSVPSRGAMWRSQVV